MKRLNLAIWFEEKRQGATGKLAVELHINVWKIVMCNSNKDVDSRFLDIGVMIGAPLPGSKLCIYIPDSSFSKNEFDDLCYTFTADNNKVLHAVFNERMAVHALSSSKFVKAVQNGKSYVSYSIDKETSDISIINDQFHGSIVKITIPVMPQECGVGCGFYTRFRLRGPCINGAFTKDNLASDTLQNFTSRIELFDIRVNEIRTLNDSLVQHMENGDIVEFSKVQFFLMCEAKEEIVLANIDQRKVRKLEKDIWGRYVSSLGKFKSRDTIIAYQWTKQPADSVDSVSDFSMLVKMKLDTMGKEKILLALGTVFVLGVLASWVAGNIPTFFNHSVNVVFQVLGERG